MNQITYIYFAGTGFVFCLLFTYRITFSDWETINWWFWSVAAIVYFSGVFWGWRRLENYLFGQSVIVDSKSYQPPPVCPICGAAGTELRGARFYGTMAGPVPVATQAQFPVLLCQSCAGKLDSKLVRLVKGIRVGRVGYDNLTVQIKNRAYLLSILKQNETSGAVKLCR